MLVVWRDECLPTQDIEKERHLKSEIIKNGLSHEEEENRKNN